VAAGDYTGRGSIPGTAGQPAVMLKELARAKQHDEGSQRREFHSADLDLVVWVENDGRCTGFELSYRHGPRERSLRWKTGVGYTHHRVDDGEDRGGRHKGTPLMVPDGVFRRWSVARKFQVESREIDPEVAGFVMRKVIAINGSGR
jgi:hypothetical protein